MNADGASGPFDQTMLCLFFVPNLLIAEFFIRNMHRRLVLPGHLKWPVVAVFGAAGLVIAYAIVMASATNTGKFGKHLLPLLGAQPLASRPLLQHWMTALRQRTRSCEGL